MDKNIKFKEVLVELLGSCMICLVSCAIRVNNLVEDSLYLKVNSLCQASVVLLFMLLVYPQARCHFTPLLTLASIIYKSLSLRQGLLIIISQFTGALFGICFYSLTLSDYQANHLERLDRSLGFPHLQEYFTSLNGLYCELIFSTCLIYIFLTYAEKETTQETMKKANIYAILRAGIIALTTLVGEQICQASLNPFLPLVGSYLSTTFYQYQWIYLIPGIIGIVFGGMLHSKDTIQTFFNQQKIKSN